MMSWASDDYAAFSDKQMERDQFPWGWDFMKEKVLEPHRLLKDEDEYIFSRRPRGIFRKWLAFCCSWRVDKKMWSLALLPGVWDFKSEIGTWCLILYHHCEQGNCSYHMQRRYLSELLARKDMIFFGICLSVLWSGIRNLHESSHLHCEVWIRTWFL